MHKLGKDRAGENNAINLLIRSDAVKINLTKTENVCAEAKDNPNAKSGVEVIHETIVDCETTQPSVIHSILELTPKTTKIKERECKEIDLNVM